MKGKVARSAAGAEVEVVPAYCERFSRWGKGQVGKTTKFKWKAQKRIRVERVGGIDFVFEPFAVAIQRMAAEDAGAA